MDYTYDPLYRHYYVADEQRRRREVARAYRLRRRIRLDRDAR